MAVTDALKNLLKRKKSIDRVSMDELRREKIRLSQEESRMTSQVEKLERQKQEFFAKGKDEPSQRQQMIIARKIKELDARAKNADKMLGMISSQIRALNGFVQLKENQQFLKERGLSSLIGKIDLSRLQRLVEDASVEGQLQMDKLAGLVTTLEESERLVDVGAEDTDTLSIVSAMQEAKAAEEEDPQVALEQGMKKVDQILEKKEEEIV